MLAVPRSRGKQFRAGPTPHACPDTEGSLPVGSVLSPVSPRLIHYSDLETVYDASERAARVAGCLRERSGPDALVAGSGDDTGPGVLSLVSEGRAALDLFGAVEPDVETVGNHDLDHGPDTLLDLVEASPQSWVLANADRRGELFGRDRGIDPWTTVDVAGTTVGVTGVLDPATEAMVPGLDAFEFRDPVETTEAVVSALRDARAELIVVLAHTRGQDAEAIARLPGVDAVLAGHEHEPRLDRVDGTVLSRPGATGRRVFEVDLDAGSVIRHDPAEFQPDRGVKEALRARALEAGLDEVVGTVDGVLPRDRSTRISGEWRLGNFVADAYRWATGADAALQNTGGIRDGPPIEGEVTVGDLIGLCPFDEPVVVAELTGEQLLAVAREADGRTVPDVPDYWLGHVSGVHVARDGDGFAVRVDEAPVDPAATYRLATPRYVLVTDREFPSLTREMAVETGALQYEVVVRYARAEGIEPALEGRVPRNQ